MSLRIEAEGITESNGIYERYIQVVCDNGLMFAETLHSKDKDSLEIVDHENFMKE